MKYEKLNPLALGYAAAITSGLIMFFLTMFAYFGIYTGAAEAMMEWHMYYDITAQGMIGGMVEASVTSFVVVAFFAWVYNKLINK